MPPKMRSHRRRNKDSGTFNIPNTAIQKTDEANGEKYLPKPDSVVAATTSMTDSQNPQSVVRRRNRNHLKKPNDRGDKQSNAQYRDNNLCSRHATDDRVKEPPPIVSLSVEDSKSPGGHENRESSTTGKRCATSRANKGSLPAYVSNYVMTLKQLYDRFRADADYIVEEAASRLEAKNDPETSGATAPTQPSLRASLPNALGQQENSTEALTTHLLLLAVMRLSLILSTEARRPRHSKEVHEASADRRAVAFSTLRELNILCKLIAWYCLETCPNGDASAPSGGGSRGASGHTTPGASSERRQGSAHPSARPQQISPSPSLPSRSAKNFRGNSNEARNLQDWFGSRMSVDQANSVTLPDNQLSEQLMRPVIEAVSRFSVYGIDPSDMVAEDELCNDNAKEASMSASAGGHDDLPTDIEKNDKIIAMMELRVSTLMALCAVLNRFPDTDFNSAAFLPLLFPSKDPRAGPYVRHPLLTPLLWDPSPAARSAAVLGLNALLYKLQSSLQFAEEPKYKHQSFVSLAVQGGTVLSTIHDVVYWAIKQGSGEFLTAGDYSSLKHEGRGDGTHVPGPPDMPSLPCSNNDATLWFNVFSALSIVTPYRRCPHSLQVMLKTLDSPVLRQHLRDESGLPFIAATGFLANVFKNESLQDRVSEHLYEIHDLAPLGGSPDTVTHEKNVDDGSYRGSFLMTDLLVHGTERVEVWRCLLHIARFYPKLIQQHFEPLLRRSCDAVDTLLRQESESSLEPEGAKPVGSQIAAVETSQPPHKTSSSYRDPKAPSFAHTSPGRARGWGTPSSGAKAANPASPCAFVECLRAWTHFMGYTWKAFDNNPGDPALKAENSEGRATLRQKVTVLNQLILRAMRLEKSEEVRIVTLRCLAQIGEGCLASAEVNAAQREEIVRYALAAAEHWSEAVRAEALTTLGVWVWQYPVLDPYGPAFLATALSALSHDSDGLVRTKAAFAVSNLTSRLEEPGNPIRESVEHIDQLFFAAMKSVTDVNSAVQGHGIRMINNLLQVLTFEELISDLPDLSGGVEECVAEGFLRTLLSFLTQSTRDAKNRWNAAYAFGTGLAQKALFEAELNYTLTAIDTLMTVVVRDNVFKVRTQAAHALGKISPECTRGTFFPPGLVPRIIRALCVALVSAKTTENFLQFREQAALQTALKESLRALIAIAVPNPELDKVLVEYHQILVGEGLQ